MDESKDPPLPPAPEDNNAKGISPDEQQLLEELVYPSLHRLTEGLPKHELSIMVNEAKACEAELLEEIRLLEEALKEEEAKSGEAKSNNETDPAATAPANPDPTGANAAGAAAVSNHPVTKSSPVDIILASEITPPDRYPTVSALFGRLREPIATPLPPFSSLIAIRQQQQQQQQQASAAQKKKVLGTATPTPEQLIEYDRRERQQAMAKQRKLLQLSAHAEYRREHADSVALLTLWKKISSHRTAAVFRRPVNPKEGMNDRQGRIYRNHQRCRFHFCLNS